MNISRELDSTIKTVPKNIDEVEKKPLQEILLLIGAGLAIIFAPIFLILDLITVGDKNPFLAIASSVAAFLVCIIFGFGLLYTYANLKNRPRTTMIIGFVCAIILFTGGIAGIVGGVLGLIAMFLYIAKRMDFLD